MDWKKIGKKMLFPPIWLQVLLMLISAAGLVWVFAGGMEASAVAYAVYVLAFYTLTVVCLFCAMVLPKQYHALKKKALDVPLINRYVNDRIFSGKVSLYLSLAVNLLYVGINLLSWFLYRSWWYVCLAVYYLILSVMRFVLTQYVRHNEIGVDRLAELRRAVSCSWILLLLNLCLSGAVLMILYQDRGYEYHGVMIYIMAMYTFYVTTNAIIKLCKYRAVGSPVMSTTKVISMAAALVSMLNLETAMFAAFGADMTLENQQLMIILTGAGVSIAVVAMSVYMIARCGAEIRRIRENGKSE